MAKELTNYLVFAKGFKCAVIGAMWGGKWYIVDTLGQQYKSKDHNFIVKRFTEIPAFK